MFVELAPEIEYNNKREITEVYYPEWGFRIKLEDRIKWYWTTPNLRYATVSKMVWLDPNQVISENPKYHNKIYGGLYIEVQEKELPEAYNLDFILTQFQLRHFEL